MIFTTNCPSCDTAFPIDAAKVPEGGVYARCSECNHVFLVATPEQAVAVGVEARESEAQGFDAGLSAPTMGTEIPPTVDAPPGTEFAGAVEDTEIVVETEAIPDAETDEHAGVVEDEIAAVDVALDAPAVDAAVDVALDTPRVDESLEAEAVPEDPTATVEVAPEAVEQPAVADHVATTAATAAPTFGKRDPNERAARLARVLVSDMIAYHPDRHRRSLAEGTLPQEFDEEIQKSWAEYVDQVGKDLAETTPYFRDALNQVLAQGADVF